MKTLATVAFGTCVAVLVSVSASAQSPVVVNGTLQTRAITGRLTRELPSLVSAQTGPVWLGYAVRGTSRRGSGSGNRNGNGDWGCWNNGGRGGVVAPVKLEGSDDLFILVRVAERRVDELRVLSSQCPLDLGGLTLHWLTGVGATDSLDWLATFTNGDDARRLESTAVTAIALHGDPAATDRLMAMARDAQNKGTRSSALFWLSQRAGDKAVGAITNALEQDPDTQVKRQAVFALSQLPRSEGVPKLIEVARTHKNQEVRRQAMFWLGQSQDPRALQFFEDVLKSR